MRFLFVKDPHFDSSGPATYRGDYYADLIEMFDQIKDYALKYKVEALLIPGDVFLREEPDKIAHTLVSKMVAYFRDFPVPIGGIIGNHDSRKGLDHYMRYPIGVLIEAGVYRYLDVNPFVFKGSGYSVKVGGVSYCKDHYYRVLDYKRGDEDFLVLLAHFFLDQNPGNFFKERVYGHGEFKDASFDVLAVGHEHVNKGIYESHGKYFIDTGMVTRVSSSESNRNLEPQIVLFSVEPEKGFKAKVLPIKCKPADKVFGDVIEGVYVESSADWSDFDERLNDVLVGSQTLDIIKEVQDLDFPGNIKSKAIAYLNANV